MNENEEDLSRQETDALRSIGKEGEGALLTDAEKDMLGEVGNISMSTAATALSKILSEKVSITTPQVSVTTLSEVKESMTIPNVVFQVKFLQGLTGFNVLLMNIEDASVIASLMMGGNGKGHTDPLSDLEISAVSEAMNQMIGSASTSMATILHRDIDITPPSTQIWETNANIEMEGVGQNQPIVKIAFRMTVEDLLDSQIMQIFNLETVKDIAGSLLGGTEPKTEKQSKMQGQSKKESDTESEQEFKRATEKTESGSAGSDPAPGKSRQQPVTIRKPGFGELENKPVSDKPRNLSLIMDVPLELSVLLGRTKKTIRDVLSLSPGSVVELDKLAEEPLEIYVNGKRIAEGEVVVINESFGIRITNIINAKERVKNLE